MFTGYRIKYESIGEMLSSVNKLRHELRQKTDKRKQIEVTAKNTNQANCLLTGFVLYSFV